MKGRNVQRILMSAAALVLLCCQAWATPILLNPPGHKAPASAGEKAILQWLENEIALYNQTRHTALPFDAASLKLDLKVEQGTTPLGSYPSFGPKTITITLPTDFNDYLVLHWGGPRGDVYQAFYLDAGPETTFTFTAPGKYGLSSYSFYGTTTIPEPASLLLVGFGLVGIAAFRRAAKFRK